MSNASGETLTGFDLWTPKDYSNFVTISAAAIGSTLLFIFKSRCKNITLCWGLLGCIREVQTDSEEEEEEDKDKDKDKDKPKPNVILREAEGSSGETILPTDNP